MNCLGGVCIYTAGIINVLQNYMCIALFLTNYSDLNRDLYMVILINVISTINSIHKVYTMYWKVTYYGRILHGIIPGACNKKKYIY